MDVYLPADFRELHAAAPDDWRDASSSFPAPPDVADGTDMMAERAERNDPDPFWRVL